MALERAAAVLGRRFGSAEALIVGDSIRDVECARAHGIPVLGVATGWTSAERLHRAGADRVVESLAGLAEALASWPEALASWPEETAGRGRPFPPGGRERDRGIGGRSGR